MDGVYSGSGIRDTGGPTICRDSNGFAMMCGEWTSDAQPKSAPNVDIHLSRIQSRIQLKTSQENLNPKIPPKMKFHQPILATGSILLVSLAVVYSQETNCYQPPPSGEPTCKPGTKLLYTYGYPKDNMMTGWCCPPGHPLEKGLIGTALGCETTSCNPIGKKDPCAGRQEYRVNGEIFTHSEDVKRESCTDKNGAAGEKVLGM
ncbi:unnamed protein product [Orchesella dallaii]|uniref:Basic tail secreted protein n=1 Tax=Orchesella dallaii TaxID=48710 RepID=A0ABP1RJ27_9HEXA